MMIRSLIFVSIGTVLLFGDDPFPREEFQRRIQDYLKARKQAQERVPPRDKDAKPAELVAYRTTLAEAIQKQRPNAKQGDVFSPAIRPPLLRIIRSEIKGTAGRPAREKLVEGNPATEGGVAVPVKVNARYPDDAPVSSMPPTMLLRLPELPKELSFRFVGNHLVLLDNDADLIVDFLPSAVAIVK
jgi:hypothetical protein